MENSFKQTSYRLPVTVKKETTKNDITKDPPPEEETHHFSL
jgi:hypothetical protein